MSPISHSVLISGGGLAGLTTALMLAWRGVRPLLVEQHAGPSRNPRARGVNFRSMELLRVAGLEPDLMAAETVPFRDFSIHIAESVTGKVLHTILPRGGFDASSLSPAPMSNVGQDRVEPILRRHAEALGADIRYGTRLESFEQEDGRVRATLRNLASGEVSTVNAAYLVAADGNRSPIRKRLGIGVHGKGALCENIQIIFEADLPSVLTPGVMDLYHIRNPAITGGFLNTDDPGRGLVSVEYDPQTASPADFDTARCIHLVRAALGVPDLEVRILEVKPWTMSSWVADRFTEGRILLAGDAAHTMPPTGGLGGQTAMQDGYDLAWKLALVLQGHADPALLSTYEAERKPAAELTVALQTANYVARMRPDRQEELRSPVGTDDYLAIATGCRYRSAAIAPDGPEEASLLADPLNPTGAPGTRGTHVILAYRGARISSIDLIGRDFVLLCGEQGGAWARAGTALRYEQGLPLSVYRMGSDLLDVEKRWESSFGVTPTGAVLLRPDGYIAWRSPSLQTSPGTALGVALAMALCRRDLGAREQAA